MLPQLAALEVVEVAYREVTMLEIREILRQWLAGVPIKRVAARLSCDPKTARRYVRAAGRLGLVPGGDGQALDDQVVAAVIAAARPARPQAHGQGWAHCVDRREFITAKLDAGVRLSKIRRLLIRSGVVIPYPTLHRFAVSELNYGRRGAVTLPVVDGEPGSEIQIDTGWVITLEPDAQGHRRKMKAWIFAPVVSRYRFVYPVDQETTASAIEACEAAWAFYGGVFAVIIPDNTKAIVIRADPLGATITPAFLEYSQSRGFFIDPARSRKPKDKGRVERSVRDVRDDCYAGEVIRDLAQARERGVVWCEHEYGARRHTTTGRMPKEHFLSDEQPRLLPVPELAFDIPLWCDPKVARDHYAAVNKALYTLPTMYIGQRLRARADSQTVRFYGPGGTLVKTHATVGPGQKSTDMADFPEHKTVYAMRDVEFLKRQASEHGPSIGDYANRLLDAPIPWMRMRQVRALLSLVRKYGADRVGMACDMALAADLIDVRRLCLMLEQPPRTAGPGPVLAKVIPIARYLRDPSQYALPLVRKTDHTTKESTDHE